MTIATAIIITAVTCGGIATLAPIAPSMAPNSAYPAIRPAMKTSGRSHPGAQPGGRDARVRSARLVRRRQRQDEAADQRHAGRDPRGEPEQQRDDEAALAQVTGARGQSREPGRLGNDG